VTQDKFIQLIEQPETLSSISYEELKTMAFAYPYAHNLRYLLALKAQQEQHPDAARALQTASTYSLERRQLFLLVASPKLTPVRQAIGNREEVLELKPIETVQRELEALSPVEKPALPRQEMATTLPGASTAEHTPPPALVDPVSEPHEMEAPSTPDIPASPQPFSSWMQQFQPPVIGHTVPARPPAAPAEIPAEKPADKPAPGVAQSLAEKSVSENQDLISETLAKLLARQGYKDKAINMYERLSLAFPEKSAYFAAEIDKLKN
jgi:hypothetical protein